MELTIIAAIFVLSILIITHELGHFSAAKLLGVRVLRFSFGLGPKIVGFRKGDTDYRISIIPFGGYVKLAGMEETESEGKKDEFLSKSTAAKIWIVLAGPIANLVLAFLVYLMVTSVIGTEILETTKIGHVEPESAAFNAGVQEGDQILMVGDKVVTNWNQVDEEIVKQTRGASLKVRRNGEELWFVMEPSKEVGIFPFIEPVVGRVQKGSPAEISGLKEGDRILAIGGTRIERWENLIDIIQTSPDTSLQIDWVRSGRLYTATIVPKSKLIVENGKAKKIGMIGILIKVSKVRLTFLSAVRVSCERVLFMSQLLLTFLGRLVTGRASVRMLGSPILITTGAGEAVRWGIDSLLNFMAAISVNLFIVSLLPIPVLDGGHIVYYLTEAIRGKPLSLRQKMISQQIGLIIIIIILAFAVLNDIMRLTQ